MTNAELVRAIQTRFGPYLSLEDTRNLTALADQLADGVIMPRRPTKAMRAALVVEFATSDPDVQGEERYHELLKAVENESLTEEK